MSRKPAPVKAFFSAVVSFMVLDFAWLGLVAKKFNLRQLAGIGRIEGGDFHPLFLPGCLVYLLMSLAIVVFVLPKVPPGSSSRRFLGWGVLMGIIVYGVYDLTNLSILLRYPLAFALVDIGWGSLAFGVVAVIAGRFHSGKRIANP